MPIKTNNTDLRPARERFSRRIRLISNGAVNGEHFPGGMITVYPWDADVDDWIVRRLRSNGAEKDSLLYDVLPRVCDLGGCPVGKFLASEVPLVLMVSRSILRGDVVSISGSCPECSAHYGESLSIPDNLSRHGEKAPDWPGYSVVTLPQIKDAVKIKLITVGEELSMMRQHNKAVGDTTYRIVSAVEAVNDTRPDNAAELVTWWKALPPTDAEFLRAAIEDLQPRLDTEIAIKCDSCSHEFKHPLALDTDFFRRPGA